MDYSKDLLECIEGRNKEFNSLLYGADYIKGLQVKNITRVLRTFNWKALLEAVSCKIADYRLKKYRVIKSKEKQIEQSGTYDSYLLLKNKKIVIYTCIIGKYDNLKEPLLAFDNVIYVCFTDDICNITSVSNTKWQIRKIPDNILSKYDKTMLNRYIKMHPKELFVQEDYAIYVDGNVKIVSFLGAYIPKIKQKTGIAIFAHSQRNCAYGEAEVCISRKKGNKEALRRQIKRYHKEGFPQGYGLYECTVIAIDLKNKTSQKIMEMWWREFVRTRSFRDQIALPYTLWKQQFDYTDIGLLGSNIFDDCKITVYGHNE